MTYIMRAITAVSPRYHRFAPQAARRFGTVLTRQAVEDGGEAGLELTVNPLTSLEDMLWLTNAAADEPVARRFN